MRNLLNSNLKIYWIGRYIYQQKIKNFPQLINIFNAYNNLTRKILLFLNVAYQQRLIQKDIPKKIRIIKKIIFHQILN